MEEDDAGGEEEEPALTDIGLDQLLHQFDKGLVDPDGQVREYLPVLRQIEIA